MRKRRKPKQKTTSAASGRAWKIWLLILAALGGLITVKDSALLIIKDVPGFFLDSFDVSPEEFRYGEPNKTISYIMKVKNTKDKFFYDVQLCFLLDDAPFESVQVQPISGKEGEKKAFPDKVIAINPHFYGIFGKNDKKQNIAYYVFRSFDPSEVKSLEIRVLDSKTRIIKATVESFSKKPSPFEVNKLTYRISKRMCIEKIRYFGSNLQGIKDVVVAPVPQGQQ